MSSKALLSLPLAGAALLWALPAQAQAQEAPDASAQLPSACQVASWTSGGPCAIGNAPAYSRQGGQMTHAIMFFGADGVQLVPTPPNAMRTSLETGAAGAGAPDRHASPLSRAWRGKYAGNTV